MRIVLPKVSVIIPVYNSSQYLDTCLESVIAQTLKEIEIICIDDDSTDNSLEILEKYAKIDDRIKIIHQKHQGQAVARNLALDRAVGEYIAFVDSDDFIHKQMLEVLVSVAEKSDVDVVSLEKFNQLSKHKSFTECINLNELKFVVHNQPLKHILSNVWSSSIIWNKVYKHDFLSDKRFIEGIYFEDWPFVTCLFAELQKYATVPYPLYTYNDLSVSTVRSHFSVKKIDDYALGIEYTYNFFNQEKYKNVKRCVQVKRITPSVSMMINKTYREKCNQLELIGHLLGVLERLRKKHFFYISDLSVKLNMRLFRLWIKNLKF